jgi:hypothetical protein
VHNYRNAAQPSLARVELLGAERAEAERIKAIRNLLLLRDHPELTGVALRQLNMFLNDVTLEVGLSGNPKKAMSRIVNGAPKRGRPKIADGDFMIAADVAIRVRNGKTVDKACEEVAELAHLAPETVRGIYYRVRRSQGLSLNAVTAGRLLCELRAQGEDPHAEL